MLLQKERIILNEWNFYEGTTNIFKKPKASFWKRKKLRRKEKKEGEKMGRSGRKTELSLPFVFVFHSAV